MRKIIKLSYIDVLVTNTVSAVASKSFSAATVVRPVGIVAESIIGITFVGIGGTFVYI